MSWKKVKIDVENLENSYETKYGADSEYQKELDLVYRSPQIYPDFKKVFSCLNLVSGMRVLDIGINSGYEITLAQEVLPRENFDEIEIIGFDVAESALKLAAQRFVGKNNYKFIKGNIKYFEGTDIVTGQMLSLANNSIDVVTALTSLQSTSLADNFEKFIETLVGKLKPSGQILVGTPNFHLDENKKILEGMYDAANQNGDSKIAFDFSQKIQRTLSAFDFEHQQYGHTIIFDYFKRKL